MDLAALIDPWIEAARGQVPGLELFDAHTHLGQNDPDGMRCTPQELVQMLEFAGARGCFVFPMHEPEGYPQANDMVIAAAREHGDGLIPFCRLDPEQDPVQEAERALKAGARGIKLHPRAEQFTLDHPNVAEIVRLAAERRLPVLIHAGRGIPALGRHAVELAGRFPEARLILAHAAICDLAWLWRVAGDHPNLLFDTSWWMPGDLRTLFSLVPPGQILFASDAPYGAPAFSAAFQLRYALQAGLSVEQVRSIASEQALRIAAGEELRPAGPAPGEREQAPHLLLDRVADFLLLGAIAAMRGNPAAEEMVGLARLSCDVPDEVDDAPLFLAIRHLIDAFAELQLQEPPDRRRIALLILGAAVASTPDVPIPSLP